MGLLFFCLGTICPAIIDDKMGKMMYISDSKGRIKRYLTAAVATCLVMLLWSAYDSPLFPLYTSGDSSIFMLIGKGITEGKIPYRDLFDHKGPFLFWVEAAGWALGGRTGIWAMETIGAVLSVFMIMKISDQLGSNPLIPVIGTAAVYLSYFGRGNLCENYSVPLVYACLYLIVKYYQSDQRKHPPVYSFVYGVCFAALAFIRINNATIICGFVLCIIIRLLMEREYINLLQNLLAGLAGIVIVSVPVCLYFYLNGALQDMLFCTFTYNFMYASKRVNLGETRLILRIVIYAPITLTTIFFGSRAVRKDYGKFSRAFIVSLFFVSALYLAELLYTSMAMHYHVMALPLYSAAAAIALPDRFLKNPIQILKDKKTGVWAAGFTVITVIYAVFSLYNAFAPVYRHYLTDYCVSRYRDVQECIRVIPEEDRDSVVGYEISTSWYIDSGITPCYKYYSLQHWWSSEGFDVNQAFMDYVSSEFPKWIIAGTDIEEDQLKRILEDHYTLATVGKWAYYRYSG